MKESLLKQIQIKAGRKAVSKFFLFSIFITLVIYLVFPVGKIFLTTVIVCIFLISFFVYKQGKYNRKSARELILKEIRNCTAMIYFWEREIKKHPIIVQELTEELELYINSLKEKTILERKIALEVFRKNNDPKLTLKTRSGLRVDINLQDLADSDLDKIFEKKTKDLQVRLRNMERIANDYCVQEKEKMRGLKNLLEQLEHNYP